jgi:hypothetical protein
MTSNRLHTIEWKAYDVCISSTANSTACFPCCPQSPSAWLRCRPSREGRFWCRKSSARSVARDRADDDGLARDHCRAPSAGRFDRIGVDDEKAQRSPKLGDALNAGFGYLEVKCLGCNTHRTVALDIVRRPKSTPVHELERYMRCKDCSDVRGHPYKRSHLVALRTTKISASDPPPSTWWPGER